MKNLFLIACAVSIIFFAVYLEHESDAEAKNAEVVTQMINNICGSDWSIDMANSATTTGIFSCRQYLQGGGWQPFTVSTSTWHEYSQISTQCSLRNIRLSFNLQKGLLFGCVDF